MSTKREEIDHRVRTAGGVISGSQPGGKQLRAGIRIKNVSEKLFHGRQKVVADQTGFRGDIRHVLECHQSQSATTLGREETADSLVPPAKIITLTWENCWLLGAVADMLSRLKGWFLAVWHILIRVAEYDSRDWITVSGLDGQHRDGPAMQHKLAPR